MGLRAKRNGGTTELYYDPCALMVMANASGACSDAKSRGGAGAGDTEGWGNSLQLKYTSPHTVRPPSPVGSCCNVATLI